ncbi:MAG: type II toxin-antitoxin system RelE/ParE family toxin [Spirochaetales bacterium]|nr:type II toxin-antitoxin system RelE/ParE family toxin [Leptospiraceae bacterium]MCP5483489.1 type II toxin-antitoxin system RelE/ParE family toxin [Spirochaetales bacterium]MCP5486759.1 type II toxin-antitoxin system RelE/ParE family toxin [Spirochaetales bacterium]
MTTLLFSDLARRDVLDAIRYYDLQRPKLGLRFSTELGRALRHLVAFPEASPVIHKSYRRALTRKFPYSIYYRVDARTILVVAVLHNHRDRARLLTDR